MLLVQVVQGLAMILSQELAHCVEGPLVLPKVAVTIQPSAFPNERMA